MPAKTTNKHAAITLAQAAANLRQMFHPRVEATWLLEFGYTANSDGMPADPLEWAVSERGARIRRELHTHAKRLADRATIGPASITSRTEVIR